MENGVFSSISLHTYILTTDNLCEYRVKNIAFYEHSSTPNQILHKTSTQW